MSVNIRKIVTVVDETLTEMGRPVSAARAPRGGDRGHRESLCGPLCRGSGAD